MFTVDEIDSRMMFFEEKFHNVCSACSEYVLDMNSDVKQWWGRESSEITEENGIKHVLVCDVVIC